MKKTFNEDEIIESVFTEAVSPRDYHIAIADHKEDIIPEIAKALKKFGLFVYNSTYIEGGDTVGCIISKRKLNTKELEEIDKREFDLDFPEDNEE
jgi:hypothetical protein